MQILLLAGAFNSLTQRVFAELGDHGHHVSVQLALNDASLRDAVHRNRPDLIIAPMLKSPVPYDIWSTHTCLIVHPGPAGDRGPSSLDFEPLDILEGVRRTVQQLERGEHRVDNAYARAVRPGGNPAAKAMLADIFEVTDRAWRGIGIIPDSGWRLSARYRAYDAEHRFSVTGITTEEPADCRSGDVLQGLIKPHECAAFGTACTPRNPLGATMVSSEGACAAYYLYRRLGGTTAPLEASPVV
ncbi:hypothetical protein LIU39_01660 [Streptomyces sp. SF28]|nr:hypothetical protein [Streptomyces pinistramenti]MCB5906150.1 hypothetical protein [Streptomyces pinistramenti]